MAALRIALGGAMKVADRTQQSIELDLRRFDIAPQLCYISSSPR